MIPDTWHLTPDMCHKTQRGIWTLCQNFRSLVLIFFSVKVSWRCWTKGSLNYWIIHSKGVFIYLPVFSRYHPCFDATNVTKFEMSPWMKCYQNWNVTKTEMTPKNWNVITTDFSLNNLMLQKLKCHQNWNVTKTEMPPKLKCHKKWNVTKTEVSQKLKSHKNWPVTKN